MGPVRGASVGGEQFFRSHVSGPCFRNRTCCSFCLLPLSIGYPDLNGKPQIESATQPVLISCAMFWKRKEMCSSDSRPVRASLHSPPGYWKMVRQACNEYGALLILMRFRLAWARRKNVCL
ncbi:MAG: hypothetical protein CM1200mP30_14270 [Pseudomonadota bacterium]|nr:MAG: hypothetical protein CM1200mP30_14270 [Pseudomonadota bacterium]